MSVRMPMQMPMFWENVILTAAIYYRGLLISAYSPQLCEFLGNHLE